MEFFKDLLLVIFGFMAVVYLMNVIYYFVMATLIGKILLVSFLIFMYSGAIWAMFGQHEDLE